MECHASIWEEWTNSHHDLAEVPLAEGEVTVDGHPALRRLGVEPLVQYLVMLNGNLQAHQLAQDSETGAWFDVFADGRQEGEWGHWTGRGMNWDTMCAVCHNTGVRRSWDNKTDTFHTEVAEYGVGCEACHGPASEHIDNPKRVLPGAKDGVESCAPCHARRSEFRNHTPGDSFSESFHPALPRHSEAWYADGQILEENFEYGSFVESKMHAAGVTCLDCHNPHTGNLTAEGNALCLSCHSGAGRIPGPVIQVSTHTGHAAESVGSQCVSCHMPTTTYMQRHPRRDHGFLIPDPRLNESVGAPNACNRCHQDRSVEWAIQEVESRPGWKGNAARRQLALKIKPSVDSWPQGVALWEALVHNQGQPASAMREAQFWMQQGQFEKAVEAGQWAEKWEANSPAPRHMQATALDSLQRRNEARSVMEQCVLDFPDDALSWYLLGLVRAAEEDWQNAREALLNALAFQPHFPEAEKNLKVLEEFLENF